MHTLGSPTEHVAATRVIKFCLFVFFKKKAAGYSFSTLLGHNLSHIIKLIKGPGTVVVVP